MRHYEFRAGIISVLVLFLLTSGCGDNFPGKRPFSYRYVSRHEVDITYKGATYRLNRHVRRHDTPFKYKFEPDGDVDITINSITYDVDSPYDIDKKTVKPKKVNKGGSSNKRSSSTSRSVRK